MSEKITTVKLKENISKNPFFLVLEAGTLELKSFHMARQLISNLFPGARNLTNKSLNARGLPGEGN